MGRPIFGALACSLLASCASTQVNFNSLEVSSTYDTLITKQVAFNVLKTYNQRYSLPAYSKIATETSQTTDTVNPTFSFPFSPATQLAQSALGITSGKTLSTAASGVSLQLTTNRNINQTLNPTNDPDQLRRLRALFQYAAGHLSQREFEAIYPLIETGSSPPSNQNTTVVSARFAGQKLSVAIGGATPDPHKPPPTKFLRWVCTAWKNENQCLGFELQEVKPDQTFVKLPGCVLCNFGTLASKVEPGKPHKDNEIVLEKNPILVGRCSRTDGCTDTKADLLFYPPDQPYGDDAIPVRTFGLEPLLVRGEGGMRAFNELALFAQEAASQGTGSPASGGQSFGRKSEPLQTISGPGGSSFVGTP